MFDLGWTELAVVALVALVVIGPKDLPKAMRTVGQYARKLRGMAREFQSGMDELAREAELDEAKKAIQGVNKLNPKKTFSDAVDPTGEVEKGVKDLDREARENLKDKSDGPATGGEAKAKRVETPTSVAPGNSVKPPSDGASSGGANKTADTGKDAAAKQPAETKSAPKKAAAKKTTAKKTAAKKTAPKKTTTKKTAASSNGDPKKTKSA